jgi:hypothetical protein
VTLVLKGAVNASAPVLVSSDETRQPSAAVHYCRRAAATAAAGAGGVEQRRVGQLKGHRPRSR